MRYNDQTEQYEDDGNRTELLTSKPKFDKKYNKITDLLHAANCKEDDWADRDKCDEDCEGCNNCGDDCEAANDLRKKAYDLDYDLHLEQTILFEKVLNNADLGYSRHLSSSTQSSYYECTYYDEKTEEDCEIKIRYSDHGQVYEGCDASVDPQGWSIDTLESEIESLIQNTINNN